MLSSGIFTDQDKKTPISDGPITAPFPFRYGMDRSADSIKANQKGQDYLSVEWGDNRMVAVLCDGVSQSFFGDLSAKFLSERLSDFFLGLALPDDLGLLDIQIRDFLQNLSSEFAETIETYPLDHVFPEFLRGVLERKRHLGSEAVFEGVLLDRSRALALLFWSGDSRIRTWKNGSEITTALFSKSEFLTQERWSSHKGLVGELHYKFLSPDQFDNLIFYSDGLTLADKEANLYAFDNIQVEKLIHQTKALPGSDDTSFFQISAVLQPAWRGDAKSEKSQLRFDVDTVKDRLLIEWAGVGSQNQWELAAVSDTGFSLLPSERSAIKTTLSEIPQNGAYFSVRNIARKNFSTWSEWYYFKPPSSSSTIPVTDNRSEVVKRTTAYIPQKLPNLTASPPPARDLSSIPTPVYGSTSASTSGKKSIANGASNRKWQGTLVFLILGMVCLASSLFIFRKKGPIEPTPYPTETRVMPELSTQPPFTQPSLIPLVQITALPFDATQHLLIILQGLKGPNPGINVQPQETELPELTEPVPPTDPPLETTPYPVETPVITEPAIPNDTPYPVEPQSSNQEGTLLSLVNVYAGNKKVLLSLLPIGSSKMGKLCSFQK